MSWTLLMLLCALLPVSAHYFSGIHSALCFHSPYLLLCSSFCLFFHYCPLITEYSKHFSTFIPSQTPMMRSSSAWLRFFLSLFPILYFIFVCFLFFNINVLFLKLEQLCHGSPGPVGGAVAVTLFDSSLVDTTCAAGRRVQRGLESWGSPSWFSFFWALCLVKFWNRNDGE